MDDTDLESLIKKLLQDKDVRLGYELNALRRQFIEALETNATREVYLRKLGLSYNEFLDQSYNLRTWARIALALGIKFKVTVNHE